MEGEVLKGEGYDMNMVLQCHPCHRASGGVSSPVSSPGGGGE